MKPVLVDELLFIEKKQRKVGVNINVACPLNLFFFTSLATLLHHLAVGLGLKSLSKLLFLLRQEKRKEF